MTVADWIFLGGLLLSLGLGALLGFGKLVKALTGGIVGVLISIVLCYCFGGMIMNIPAVSALLSRLSANWAGNAFLVKIHLEVIIYYVALFIIFSLLRVLIVFIFKNIAESDVLVMKIINKACGALLFAAVALLLMFLVFQIIVWIGGSTAAEFDSKLAGSMIVRPLFEHNPMAALVARIKGSLFG